MIILLSKETIITIFLSFFFFSGYNVRHVFLFFSSFFKKQTRHEEEEDEQEEDEQEEESRFKKIEPDEPMSSDKQVREDEPVTKELNYYEKYLEDIRKMSKEFVLNEDEKEVESSTFLQLITSETEKQIQQMEKIKDKLGIIEETLTLYESNEFDYENRIQEYLCGDDDDDDDEDIKETKEEKIQYLLDEQTILHQEYDALVLSSRNTEEVLLLCAKEANQVVINKKLDHLKNCFVIEKTPLGNVLITYDHVRNSFPYYSDHTIPYRYLETVARKYVKQFNCRPIFVDMEEELKQADEKWEKNSKEKEEIERKKKDSMMSKTFFEEKKSVFAKFKSYNTEAGTGKVQRVAPPKNNISNKSIVKENENTKILLKEKSNRYTYEGKMSNFNFLKKIERKVVDKKYAMSFSDFKKIQENKQKYGK
jgi:hypothetical protein